MNGPIAQLAALVCHANAFLSGREIPRMLPGHSTCQFCERIEFVAVEADRRVVAPGPDEWIHGLPLREIDGIRLVCQPRNDPNISDRLAAGFAGGGRVWQMHVLRDDGQTEVWSAHWSVGDRDAADRRIWRVEYRRETVQASAVYRSHNLAVIRQTFADRLTDIKTFAERHTDGGFAACFQAALAALDEPDAGFAQYPDIALPDQLAPPARALLEASQRAWVFGGMGSWNDMSFGPDLSTEYEHVSDGLFDIVHDAIECAISSTYLAS